MSELAVHELPVAVIGAGPAGLAAAAHLRGRGMCWCWSPVRRPALRSLSGVTSDVRGAFHLTELPAENTHGSLLGAGLLEDR